MARDAAHTNIALPSELVAELDARIGRRQRNQFIAKLVEERLHRLRLLEAAEAAAGSLVDADIPGWETSESAAEWVHNLRRDDTLHRQQKLDRPWPPIS